MVLLPIYPAREEPIEGITSEIIAERVTVPCRIVDRDRLAETVAAMDTDVVIRARGGEYRRLLRSVGRVSLKKKS